MAVNMEMEDRRRRVDVEVFSKESNGPGACTESLREEDNPLRPEGSVSKSNDEPPPADISCTASTWRTTVPKVLEEIVPEDNPTAKETVAETEPEEDFHLPQPPLAFTIEFHDNKQVDATKYHNLFERYSARHKRNSSTSKVEVSARKQSSLLSPNSLPKQKVPSTHSEGYFSSEDDTKRKTDQLLDKLKQSGSVSESVSKRKPTMERSELPSTGMTRASRYREDRTSRSYEGRSTRDKLSRENLSLELENSSETNGKPYWATRNFTTINNLSRVQMNNYDDENNEKCYTKNIDYVNNDYELKPDAADPDPDPDPEADPTIADLSEKISNIDSSLNDYNAKNINERDCNLSSVSHTMDLERSANPTNATNANLDVFNVSNVDAGSDGAVSEAGTYTIHKDYTDEEKARMDIDKVFSVGVLTEEEYNEPYVHSFKMSISRDNNTWISEWASQVAEHNSLPPVIGGTTGRTPPLSPSKIPSPINTRMQRTYRSRHEQSDSSIDAESYLRIKERFCTSSNQNTLIDSGGESDDDTSNSYNTPPHSSQRTPTHGTHLTRRSSLSESLLRRMSSNENRSTTRKYYNMDYSKKDETISESLKTPSQLVTSRCMGRRSSSLDRKEYMSDTTESNTSRKSSLKHCPGDHSKHTNSPVLSRLNCATSKLTNSPIISRKTSSTNMIIDSPTSERNQNLVKSMSHAKNVGYFTCVENSPYMLRKSNSTTSYHETTVGVEFPHKKISLLQKNPEFRHAPNIQRSSSNASIRNMKAPIGLGRRSSFNNNDIEKTSERGRFNAASDSSSETGERQTKSSAQHTPSSNIKFNRAFSVRRARLECESDTTPNTTPEEKRRRARAEVKPAAAVTSKQSNQHRSRTSSVGAYSKESIQKTDLSKARAPSISRTDSGRFSMRIPKSSYSTTPPTTQKSTQKPSKDQKKSARSNSTLTSKEVEFQNWKRRKNYDPMKAAAEGRKKLADTSRKQSSVENSSEGYDNSVLRSASFHGTGGSLSVANDWIDNETNFRDNDDEHAPPPSSPQLDSDSDLETSSYLQATQNVVSAMSARITVYRPSLMDSDGESDEDTSHSLYRNTSKAHRKRVSDTESSDERQPIAQPPISNTKYNRAFSLRRARLEPQAAKTTPSSVTSKTCQESRSKLEPTVGIARTDSGRFSMRLGRSNNSGAKAKAKETKKPAVPNTREVEMQNWKRRKSYDPMKAAMEGRKKATLLKKNSTTGLSPSHVARSQSFHGSAGLGTNDWSDEELAASADETPLY